jgi:ribosome-associated protein
MKNLNGGVFLKENHNLVNLLNVLEDKMCENTVILDIESTTIFGDYFVITTVKSKNQMRAVVDELVDYLKSVGEEVLYFDKDHELDWNVVDTGDIIFHIFTEKGREYYDLESLWYDLPRIDKNTILNKQEV